MIAPALVSWIVETLVATTLLMLLVLTVRQAVSRQFGPNIAYALWLLPVLRMLMPPLPGAWQFTALIAPLTQSVQTGPGLTFGVLDGDAMPPSVVDQALVQTQLDLGGHHANLALVPPTTVAGGPNIVVLLIGLWAIGALVFLGYHLIAHRRFCAGLLRRAKVQRTVAEGRVHVIETDATTGPLAFGIWRKYVAFPRDFSERYDPLERNLALAHELGHHLRGDLIANWVALVMLALHWFNPVAWRAFRAFRADQEIACDALVLSGRAPALRHAYGRAIVKSAHGGAVSAACHLHTINELKGRLKMLSKHNRKSRTRITAGITGAIALTLGALALTASGSEAAATLTADLIQTPPAPEPPAQPPAAQSPPAPIAPKAPEEPATVRTIQIIQKGAPEKGTKAASADERRVMKHVIVKDGKTVTWSSGETPAVPHVSTITCGGAQDGPVKMETQEAGKRKIVICTDRIEHRAARAEVRAKEHAKTAEAHAGEARVIAIASADMGKHQARMGLEMARRSIAMQDSLTPAQKAGALKGIDQAIRELDSAEQD